MPGLGLHIAQSKVRLLPVLRIRVDTLTSSSFPNSIIQTAVFLGFLPKKNAGTVGYEHGKR